MERPATWKVVTLGAALTGFGIVGAGAAQASSGAAAAAPASITAGTNVEAPQFPRIEIDVPGVDDFSYFIPGQQFVALDDDTSWDESYWDTSWDD